MSPSYSGVLPATGPIAPPRYPPVRGPVNSSSTNARTDGEHAARMRQPLYRKQWLKRWNDPAIREHMARYADAEYGPVIKPEFEAQRQRPARHTERPSGDAA